MTQRAAYRQTQRLKPEERRRLILAVARNVILERGFAGLTLRAVADRAEIRLATLQYYFRTSDKLFRAAFRDAADTAWKRLVTDLPSGRATDPVRHLQRVLQGLYDTTKESEISGFFVELWAQARVDDFASNLMREYYSEAIEHLAGLIASCEPDLKGAEARRRATLVMASVEGFTVLNVINEASPSRTSLSPARAVRNLLALAQGQRAS